MFGKASHLKSLGLRKKLLIAESNLNRFKLIDQCGSLKKNAGQLLSATAYQGTMVLTGTWLISQLFGHWGGKARKNNEVAPSRSQGLWSKGLKLASWFLPSLLGQTLKPNPNPSSE